MLTGIHVEIDGENVKLTATDRFRLAQRHLTWEPAHPGVNADLLIPAKTLLDNARTLDTSIDEPVELAAGSADNIGGDGLFTAFNDEPNWRKAHNILPRVLARGYEPVPHHNGRCRAKAPRSVGPLRSRCLSSRDTGGHLSLIHI